MFQNKWVVRGSKYLIVILFAFKPFAPPLRENFKLTRDSGAAVPSRKSRLCEFVSYTRRGQKFLIEIIDIIRINYDTADMDTGLILCREFKWCSKNSRVNVTVIN